MYINNVFTSDVTKVYGYDIYEVILYITDLLLLCCVFYLYTYYYNNIMLMMTVTTKWFHLTDLRIFIPKLQVSDLNASVIHAVNISFLPEIQTSLI